MTDQLADNNRNRMEHLLLLEKTIGSKDLTISSAQLVGKLIVHTNQSSAFIDIQGHGDHDFPFRSWKSGNKMSVDFGQNAYENIGINP